MKLADTITVVLCLLCSYMPRRKFSPIKISGILVDLCKKGPTPSKGNEYFFRWTADTYTLPDGSKISTDILMAIG